MLAILYSPPADQARIIGVAEISVNPGFAAFERSKMLRLRSGRADAMGYKSGTDQSGLMWQCWLKSTEAIPRRYLNAQDQALMEFTLQLSPVSAGYSKIVCSRSGPMLMNFTGSPSSSPIEST